MNLTPQPFRGEDQMREDLKKLKEKHKKDMETQRERLKNKVQVKAGNPIYAFLLSAIGIILSVCLHFYTQPETFINRLIIALLFIILIGGFNWLSFVIWQKMRAK